MTIFNLKQDLIIPFKGESYITFPKEHFELSYNIEPNYQDKYLNVTVDIVYKETKEKAKTFLEFTITEQGFETDIISNLEDIHAWDINHAALQSQLENASEEETFQIIYQITNLGQRPQEQKLFINKYSQVIDYFNNKGELTEQGIIWAKNLPQFKDII